MNFNSKSTRDPIAEAVELIIEAAQRPDLWEKEKIADMLKMFRGGKSLNSIARFYECRDETIKRILLTNMPPEEFKRLIQQHRSKLRPDLREKEKIADMLKMFRGGKSLNSIARFYKCKAEVIRYILLTNMPPEEFNELAQRELRLDLRDPKKIEDMVKKLRGGKSLTSIAKIYHASVDTIRNILLKNMPSEEFKRLIQQHRDNQRPDLWETEKIENMLKRFRGGESLNSIARFYHCDRDTIRYILLKNMPPEEYKEILSRRSIGSRIRSRSVQPRLQDDDPRIDSPNVYSSRATGDDPVLSGPTRDPIAEAVDLVVEGARRKDLHSSKDKNPIAEAVELIIETKIQRPDLWKEENIADMLKRFRDGKPLLSIAKHYEATYDTIRRILLSPRGGKMPKEEFKRLIQQHKNELRPDLWETEKIEDMLKRFRDGESLNSIANDEVYKTSNLTIRRILLHPNGGKMSQEEFDRLAQQHRPEFRPDLREPEKIEDMLKRFRDGKSLRSIAGHYETTYNAIKRILSRNMSPEEYKEILSRRSMGSRIKRGPKGSRITPEDPNADPANTYSSRATGDDPVLSGPTRDPIAEAVELVISNHYNFLQR